MIKKLRYKFIAVAMLSVTLVLSLIIGSAVLYNYSTVRENCESRIDLVVSNAAVFSGTLTPFDFLLPGGFSPEARYDTRYFTVLLSPSGEALSVNTVYIAAIDSGEAVELAQSLFAEKSAGGFAGVYRYRALGSASGVLYVFVDSSRELETFRSFVLSALIAFGAGLILIFLLVLFLSKVVTRPVAATYEKQKRFITDASHEIKTPLAIINAAAEVVEMENGESEWTDSIMKQVERLTGLTDRLVSLSRMDEDGYKPVKKNFCLSDAVSDMFLSFEAVAEDMGKQLVSHIEPGIYYDGDENSIRQAVSLLTDNALKYSSAGSAVELHVSSSGRYKQIVMKNACEDIKKGSHSELFERFYRNDESRSSSTGGHGIGLSVARAVASAHNGKISAYSPDGKSIVFTLLLG